MTTLMGTSSWPEHVSNKRQKAIKELVHGQECATQLQILLHKPIQDNHASYSLSANQLVLKILTSFTNARSVLSSYDHSTLSGEVSQNLPTSCDDSPCYDDRRSEDSGESKKRRPASKDKRGCYKRKKNSEMWTIVSHTMEDSHAWRKYGQKEILNAKYPRSYFRCTRKYDQGCQATKQVQLMEEDPQIYQTTYIGVHTCRKMHNPPQFITDSDPCWESYILSPSDSKVVAPKMKQESKEDTPSDPAVDDSLSSMDSIMWKDLMPFGPSDQPVVMSPKMGSDYGDVVSTMYSCTETTTSAHSFDHMGFGVNSVDFESDFHLDESEFF